ncbi:hypothetical protein F5Y17DRAFT_246281 [Xylariaceae sp. FL0594]|nr:hypothetical protein F5Y17DRAFT_246281 [Xylariaceae sp. FL0594]
MATIALPRPVPSHRSSSDMIDVSTRSIALDTNLEKQQAAYPAPIPNKRIPSCPTGTPRARNTPPPSPGREEDGDEEGEGEGEEVESYNDRHRRRRRRLSPSPSPSSLHPPERGRGVQCGGHTIYSIDAAAVADAVYHTATQPLPEPSKVFPWFHGLHPDNSVQQYFFTGIHQMKMRPRMCKSPHCLRGLTIVKADGNLAECRLKGAIAPQEILQPGSDGEFVETDPRDGFSVRNFHIQVAKTAVTSDIVVYGDDQAAVRDVASKVAAAQAKWREKQRAQWSEIPEYNTFFCVTPFAEFERRHGDIVAVDSSGSLTGAVLDFHQQERTEMYAMTKASEISSNVWLGPTLEPGCEEEQQYDILIECSDVGRLHPGALQVIAEGRQYDKRHADLEFPSPPTWSHGEGDEILDTCKWIWHLAHGTLPAGPGDEPDDAEGDTAMEADTGTKTESTQDGLRPRRILLHCADGYTETTLLAIAYFSYSTGRAVADAWLDLHTVLKRNFFATPTDAVLLSCIAPRLLRESPVCAHKSLAQITAMVRNEPRWLAALDGSMPSRILDHMYLGNLSHANNSELLWALGITQVISVGETTTWTPGAWDRWGGENVFQIRHIQDNGIDSLTGAIPECLDFIERGRKRGTATLVHCRVGVSRSATICIAAVMRSLNMSFPRAYCFVRARRLNVIIQPHLRFVYELLKWEEHLQARWQRDRPNPAAAVGRPGRELEWGEVAREIALLNQPYAR